MPELKITPVEPVPENGQPELIVEYTCVRCGTRCRRELSKPGFIPRYCDDCVKLAAADRVKRWRERHPDQARAAAKEQNAKRPRKETKTRPADNGRFASNPENEPVPAASTVNDASLTSRPSQADLPKPTPEKKGMSPEETHLLAAFAYNHQEGGRGVLRWNVYSQSHKKDKAALLSLVRRGFIEIIHKERSEVIYKLTGLGLSSAE